MRAKFVSFLLKTYTFHQSNPGQKYIFDGLTNKSNLRTQAQRIIKKAGLKPWGKLFQNLRSTRETELVEKFPDHVVTGWLGNSPDIARKHYLQTHEEHFQRAVEKEGLNQGLNPAANPGNYSQSGNSGIDFNLDFAGVYEGLRELAIMDNSCQTPRVGLEPTT